MRRVFPRIRLVFVFLLAVISAASTLRAAELPAQISDEAFWTMISDFSNPMVISAENFLFTSAWGRSRTPTSWRCNRRSHSSLIGLCSEFHVRDRKLDIA